MTQCNTIHQSTTQHNRIQRNTTQCNATHYRTTQHNTIKGLYVLCPQTEGVNPTSNIALARIKSSESMASAADRRAFVPIPKKKKMKKIDKEVRERDSDRERVCVREGERGRERD